MFSYTHQPVCATPRSAQPQTQRTDVKQRGDVSDARFLEVIEDDVATLDYLLGVTLVNGGYSFVQYRPTEKHKRCAGTRISPVRQINMFIDALRDNHVTVEMAICTLTGCNQKTLWLRVPLSGLKELSLEPLWMIRGRVQLFGKQQCIAIAIHDRALEGALLDRGTALLLESHRDQVDRTRQGEDTITQDCIRQVSHHEQPPIPESRKRTLIEQECDRAASKKCRPLDCDRTYDRKQYTACGVKPRFNVTKRCARTKRHKT